MTKLLKRRFFNKHGAGTRKIENSLLWFGYKVSSKAWSLMKAVFRERVFRKVIGSCLYKWINPLKNPKYA
jgi:hypothetical protein